MDQIFQTEAELDAAIKAGLEPAPESAVMEAATQAPQGPAPIPQDMQQEQPAPLSPSPVDPVAAVQNAIPAQQAPRITPQDLQIIANSATGRTQVREQQPTPYDPVANVKPPVTPPGMTMIPQEMFRSAVQAAAMSFPSMNEVGILVAPQDRTAFAISVMSNPQLRSDMKAQIADQVMRDGRIALEALPKAWYESRNLILP